MNVLICDDRRREAEKFAELLADSGFDVSAVIFSDGGQALDHIRSGGLADVCFLDIFMPDMNGVELAEKLREERYTGEIVFLTASNDFAQQSYRVKAFDYLLKPPTADSVREVMNALVNAHKNTDRDGLPVKTRGMARFILFRDISHVEVIGHTIYVRLLNGAEVEVYATFGEIAEHLLRDGRFVRCHRSYIVNVSDVSTVTAQEAVMNSGARVPISRGFSQVRDEMMKWMFGGGRK